MTTTKDLLTYAQDLIKELGEDAPISFNVIDVTDIEKILDEQGIDLQNNLEGELLSDLFYIIEKYGYTTYEELTDMLFEFESGKQSFYFEELLERRKIKRGLV